VISPSFFLGSNVFEYLQALGYHIILDLPLEIVMRMKIDDLHEMITSGLEL
jgi:hypothetical protein